MYHEAIYITSAIPNSKKKRHLTLAHMLLEHELVKNRLKDMIQDFEDQCLSFLTLSKKEEGNEKFHFQVSRALVESLKRPWGSSVYLPGLDQRCAKLNFQVRFLLSFKKLTRIKISRN
jgi:hypothetical protein